MNFYEILGVSNTATPEEIKKAYRLKAKQHHPDKGGDEETFKKINEAYETLSDENKRKHYDQYGNNDFNANSAYNDFMSHFRDKKPIIYGTNIEIQVELSLEEIHTGINKEIEYNKKIQCAPCNGNGGTNITTCKVCSGTGVTLIIRNTPFGYIQTNTVCEHCNGSGEYPENICDKCNGHGVIDNRIKTSIQIPKGVPDKIAMKIPNMGNSIKNGLNGDLYIITKEINHPNYIRDGANLIYKIDLSYTQLVLGDKIQIPIIDNSKISINIKEGTQVGQNLRIREKGLSKFREHGAGDLIINIGIKIPKKLTDTEKKLIEELKIQELNLSN